MTDFIKRHPLIFIFMLAVVARVLLLFAFPLPDQAGGDFSLYQRMADNILAQGNLGGEPQKTYGSPSISPGFAFFLAGYEFFFGKSIAALVPASVVMSGLLAVSVYLLALRFFDERVAFIAGIVTALWPVFLIQTFAYGNSLLLYTTVLIWGVYFLAKAVRGEHWLYAVLSGILLGFAALVDAVGFFIPFVLVAWLFFERFEWRTIRIALLFLVAVGLVIAPWTYRNIIVAEQLGVQSGSPIISKGEIKHVTPKQLSLTAKLVSADGVLSSGLSKIYVFPYDISALDRLSVETEAQREAFSYKERLFKLVLGDDVALSYKEQVVLMIKISITLLHWLLLALAGGALVYMIRSRRWSLPVLVVLLTGYVTVAVIGFGSLAQDDFQSISGPNSFLFPLVPLFIILASFSLVSLYEKIKAIKNTLPPA
ncbi:MAG TPA: glycosyltransferase family 39 protein [Candidatus Paceibacterota bacterium]|jgi:4-amino-4-deoxy-L-arabinose transferase-like glycosyltransferase